MSRVPAAINHENPKSPVVRRLVRSNVRNAALAAFVVALAIVYFLPRCGLTLQLVNLATWFGAGAALLCALTFWQKVRVQIGRSGLRYKSVRRGAAIASVIGFSVLSAQIASISMANGRGESGSYSSSTPSSPVTLPVAFAHFKGDSRNRIEDNLVSELDSSDPDFPIRIVKVDQTFDAEPSLSDSTIFNHLNIVDYLQRNRVSLMIWGSVDPKSGLPRIYETSVIEGGQFGGAYRPPDFKLPELPVEDLAPILRLVVSTQSINGTRVNPQTAASGLAHLLAHVNQIAAANRGNSSWSPDTRARVDFILAVATAVQGGLLWDPQTLRISIAEYLSTIAEWSEPEHALDRAMALRSLAEPLKIMALMERERKPYDVAARAYSEAIANYSAASDTLDAANAARSLGQVFKEISVIDNGKELPQALAAYRAALPVFSQQHYPMEWAATQSDIAETLVAMGKLESGNGRLLEAVGIYQQILPVWNRTQMPYAWAKTQLAMGVALADLGMRDSSGAYLAQAITAERSALEVLTAEADPVTWSRAQSELGLALSQLAERDGSLTEFQQAIDALRVGSTSEFRKRDPYGWDAAQGTLVMTLEHLGMVEWLREGFDETSIAALDSSSQEHLEEAVATARSDLDEVSKESDSSAWAYLQSKLGASLKEIGEREDDHNQLGGEGHLREAVQAYNAALTEMTISSDPRTWAETESGLGDALRELGTRESDRESLEQAIACYQMADEVETADRDPVNWAVTQESIGRIYETLGLLDPGDAGTADLQKAVNFYTTAVSATNRDNDLRNWVIHQRHLAHAEAELGKREPGVDYLQRAAAAYREELKYLSPDRSATEWADANKRLGSVLDLLHQRGADG
jgi:tetratricopeptide (TPR) repeat protein